MTQDAILHVECSGSSRITEKLTMKCGETNFCSITLREHWYFGDAANTVIHSGINMEWLPKQSAFLSVAYQFSPVFHRNSKEIPRFPRASQKIHIFSNERLLTRPISDLRKVLPKTLRCTLRSRFSVFLSTQLLKQIKYKIRKIFFSTKESSQKIKQRDNHEASRIFRGRKGLRMRAVDQQLCRFFYQEQVQRLD